MTNLFDILKSVGYKVDDLNKDAIYEISDYLAGDQKKGMLFEGYFGTGKTWLMKIIADHFTPIRIVSTEQIIREILNEPTDPKNPKHGNVPEKYLTQQYTYSCNDAFGVATFRERPFCFDELGGQNDRKLNIFGTETYPMSIILKTHHEKNIKCHAITNFKLTDLENLYGGETVDRFKTMFVSIKFKGNSRR